MKKRSQQMLTGLMWSVIVAGLAFTNAGVGEASINDADNKLSTGDQEFMDKVQRRVRDYEVNKV